MAIPKGDVVPLMNEFHDTVMFKNGRWKTGRGSSCSRAAYLCLSPARTSHFRPTMKFHQKLTDERHIVLEPFNITPL